VVAVAQLKRDTSKSVTQTVTLQALDAKGHPVDVGISPQVTTVKIPVTAGTGTKQVPLKIKTKNGSASNFNLTGSVNEITVRGKIDVLNKLKEIPVTVDLNGVTAASSQDVTVNTPDGTDSVNPTTVTVTITPKEQ
jgi:YbbR domain-containing protein